MSFHFSCERAAQQGRKFDCAATVFASYHCPALQPHCRPQSLLPWMQVPTPIALKPIPLLPWLRIAPPVANAKDPTPVVTGVDLNPSFHETPPLVAMAADRTSCCHGCKYSQCFSDCGIRVPCCHYRRPQPLFPWRLTLPPVAMTVNFTPCSHGSRPHLSLPWKRTAPTVAVVVDSPPVSMGVAPASCCHGCRPYPSCHDCRLHPLLPWQQSSTMDIQLAPN